MSKKLKITEEQLKRLVDNKTINENEEGMESNYMFFSNLEQIHRQSKLLMELDQQKVNEVLNNGHDWADDHITVSKENLSQVFDFMMNEFKGSGDNEQESHKFMSHGDFSLNEQGDLNETGIGSVEMALAKEVVPFIIEKLQEKGIDKNNIDMGIFTRALHHEITNHKDEYDPFYDRDEEINYGVEDDDMMNESIKNIKLNFKRFL
jgi:hypothetical protein